MEFMLDSANVNLITDYINNLPIDGITTNPSILKKEGRRNFLEHCNELHKLINPLGSLHVQVTGRSKYEIISEAEYIHNNIGKDVYIKIPVTLNGISAIIELKKRNYNITATAIYTKMQGILAIKAGADYIAPYYNRMEGLDINAQDTIKYLVNFIQMHKYNTKVLAASFKNISQVNSAIDIGVHAITIGTDLVDSIFAHPSINKAISDFHNDWVFYTGEDKLINEINYMSKLQ